MYACCLTNRIGPRRGLLDDRKGPHERVLLHYEPMGESFVVLRFLAICTQRSMIRLTRKLIRCHAYLLHSFAEGSIKKDIFNNTALTQESDVNNQDFNSKHSHFWRTYTAEISTMVVIVKETAKASGRKILASWREKPSRPHVPL